MYVGYSLVDRVTGILPFLRRIYSIEVSLISTSCPVSFPFLISCYMERWMTSHCGSAVKEGKSLGYSALTRQQAGYADFSRSLQQHRGMALMQSKLPQSYGFQSLSWTVNAWLNLVNYQWNKSQKAVLICLTTVYYLWQSFLLKFILWLFIFCNFILSCHGNLRTEDAHWGKVFLCQFVKWNVFMGVWSTLSVPMYDKSLINESDFEKPLSTVYH